MGRFGEFTAEFDESAFQLRYVSLPWRTKTEIIGRHHVLKARGLPHPPMPVSYQYMEITDTQRRKSIPDLDKRFDIPRNYGVIKIVAGPRMSLSLKGVPFGNYVPGPLYPFLEIIRVQDPDMVPLIGSGFNTSHLLGEYEVNPGGAAIFREIIEKGDPSKGLGSGMAAKVFVPPNYFTVARMHNGVLIRHWRTLQDLRITVPRFFGDPDFGPSANDAVAKFAYQFNALGKLGEKRRKASLPLLEIVATPGVQVTLSKLPRIQQSPFVSSSMTEDIPFFQLYEAGLLDVPDQGEDFLPRTSWTEIPYDKVPVKQIVALSAAMTIFDLAFRFMPYVGVAMDLLDIARGIHEGRDIYGREMGYSDIAMLAGGLFVHGVSTGLAATSRSRAKLSKLFGHRADDADELFKATRRARITKEEIENVDEVTRLITRGEVVPPANSFVYSKMLGKIKVTPPPFGTIVNRDATGFVVSDLQEGYRNYVARQQLAGADVASPVEWAINQTRGRYAPILAALLGRDFRKALRGGERLISEDRLIQLSDVPRPTGYKTSEMEADLDHLLRKQNYGKLVERLDSLFPKSPVGLKGEAILMREVVTPRVSRGLMGIIKGNIAEVFAESTKREILKEIAKRHPDAFLLSGVRIDLFQDGVLTSANKGLLFSDDIIARFDKGNLQFLALFEVKAGYGGGQKATRQIFDWIEEKLTFGDGSKIVLPAGAKLSRIEKGSFKTRTLKSQLDFTYKPPAGSKGRRPREATNVVASDRYILTAAGQSHLGINSSHQSVRVPTRLELKPAPLTATTRGTTVLIDRPIDVREIREITSDQMDYLAALLMGRLARF